VERVAEMIKKRGHSGAILLLDGCRKSEAVTFVVDPNTGGYSPSYMLEPFVPVQVMTSTVLF
jgi:hypothetical protein